jgi:hypothetical protein
VPIFSLASICICILSNQKQKQHAMECEIDWLYNFFALILIQLIKSLKNLQNNILIHYRHCQLPLFKLLQTSILTAIAFLIGLCNMYFQETVIWTRFSITNGVIMGYKKRHKPKKVSPIC